MLKITNKKIELISYSRKTKAKAKRPKKKKNQIINLKKIKMKTSLYVLKKMKKNN